MRKICVLFIVSLVWVGGFAQVAIQAEDAKKHIGEVVTLCGKVYSAKYLKSATNQPTLLNLGGNYPNQLVTVAIFETDRKNFPFNPEEYYPNLEVCITGKLIEYKGTPEMVVQSPDQVKLQIASARDTNTLVKKEAEPAKAKEKAPTKVEAATATPAKMEEGDFEVKLSQDVNLRSGPSTDYGVVAELKAGSLVSVVRSNNGWSYVLVKKGTAKPVNGYIKNNVLK